MAYAGIRPTQREVTTFAHALSNYGDRHGLNACALAAYLGCSEQALTLLTRRHCPDADDSRFEGQIIHVAQAIGCYAWQLREIALTIASDRG